MITWIKKKHYENKVMLAFYQSLSNLLDEQKNITAFISRLYISLKDTSVDELKSEFISELAEMIHDSAKMERDKNK